MHDQDLLQRWVTERSETAFAVLVRRHIGLVYGSALRQVRDPELARDITQAVFVLLAQKAASLRPQVVLAGWLLRSASYVAARTQRTESRRRLREHSSVVMNDPAHRAPDEVELWEEVAPHLDAALVALSTADRDAVVLRYFEQLPVRDVGLRLGLSEEATKKRLQRVLEKLRRTFQAKGVLVTLVGLSSLLSQVPAQSVPPWWVDQVVRAAVSTTATPAAISLGERWTDWWQNSSGWMPWVAVSVTVLLSVGWWWRPNSTTSGSWASSAQTSANHSGLDPNALLSGQQYRLVAQSAATGEPLVASIYWEMERDGEVLATGEGETSSTGLWTWPKSEREFDSFTVWVAARKHVPRRSVWQGHELTAAPPNETFLLEPGTSLRGQVVDSQGQPVAGARINLGLTSGESRRMRQRASFHPRVHALSTDDQGRFQTDWIPRLENQRLVLHVDHPDFVPLTESIGGTGQPPADPRLVLSRGGWIHGQVVLGAEGQPAPNVALTFSATTIPGERQIVADELGHFKVGPFPPGPVRLRVELDGFVPISSQFEMPDGPKELQVYLPSSLAMQDPETSSKRVRQRIRGSVTDAQTGKPIPRFRVSSGAQFLGEGTDGVFDWTVSLVRQDRYSLEIEADGYLAGATPAREYSADDAEMSVQLTAGREIRGTVVDQAKRPMEGVMVALLGSEVPASLSAEGSLSGTLGHTLTDFAGRFSFPPNADANRVFALAASGTAGAVIESSELSLEIQPWGVIEGHWHSAATEVTFNLEVRLSPENQLSNLSGYSQGLIEDGRFRFERVPAGALAISAFQFGNGRILRTASAAVQVQPGETQRVDLIPRTRDVRVELTHQNPRGEHSWLHGSVELVPKVAPPEARGPTTSETESLMDDWDHRSALFYRSEPDQANFSWVRPGEYRLTIKLFGEADPSQPDRLPVVATVDQSITIPAATSADDGPWIVPIEVPVP